MTKNGKYTQIKTVRLTKKQEDTLKEMGVKIRDTIEYYIENNTNELQRLKQRERYLLKQIPILEDELNNLKEELKEVSEKLGHNTDKDQVQIEVSIAGDRILNNCKVLNNNKADNETLANYLLSYDGKQTLNNLIGELNIKDKEEFKNKISKYLEI